MSVTLEEIRAHWCLCDVWDANLYLDIVDDVEILARRAAENKAR